MNVLVLTNMSPFVHGGAEELAHHLVRNLNLHGANAEAMRIPFSWEPPERLIEEIALCRCLRVTNVDRVIALKFPAYNVPHANKVIWLLHQYRQAYDLFDAGQTNLHGPRGDEIRRLIWVSDAQVFESASQIYTNSRVTAERLRHYNGFASDVLMPPLNDPELFQCGEYGDYLLAPGRVGAAKRQMLVVEAMRHLPRSIKLVVAGPPDTEDYATRLRALVARSGLEQRVRLELRFLSRKELAAAVNGARAIVYLPFDEDSVGYVTMEACQAEKPVVTTADSGGLLQLIEDGVTGRVADASAKALAAAIAPLFEGTGAAIRLGREARARWEGLGINWPDTISRLLG
jgi:glycosyltransferase involved in cell wall biosynthesis